MFLYGQDVKVGMGLGIKDLENSGKVLEKVLIDVSEQETEKPKKNKKGSFQARKKSTRTKP